MLSYEHTRDNWKTHCVFFNAETIRDDYGNERTEKGAIITESALCFQPVENISIIEEYGLSHKVSLQAVLYDFSVQLKISDLVEVFDDMYAIKGIKRFPSYRLLILERCMQYGENQI